MSSQPRSLRALGLEQHAGVLLEPERTLAYLKERGAWPYSLSKLYDFLSVDAIPNVRVNGRYYSHPAELDDWLANGDLNRRRQQAPALSPEVIANAVAEGIRLALRTGVA
jgi:hypothetical protein